MQRLYKTGLCGVWALALCLPLCMTVHAQIPPAPNPPQLVNDFARVFSADEASALEHDLDIYADTAGAQIAVVTVTDLGGYDIVDFAVEVGQKWGVGGEKNDNGVVVLVKVKTAHSKGEATIATGYGTEGALPDAVCRRIIENAMIPHFREDDYAGGIRKAADIIMQLLSGEEWVDEDELAPWEIAAIIAIFLFLVCFVALLVRASKNGNGGTGTGNGTTGGRSARPFIFVGGTGGGFGGGSSAGGFGGFGGGSFGGGGARGSW